MIPDKDYEMVEAMEKYGGSFVKCLATLLHHADIINYLKLESIFPEYFKQYKEMAERISKNK